MVSNHDKAARMNPLFHSREILAEYGISAAGLSSEALRVAVVARLPRSADREQFNALADKCGTRDDLTNLAARTLRAFEKRGTPLRPPPSEEDDVELGGKGEDTTESQAPYTVK
jgi:hypothetical protein